VLTVGLHTCFSPAAFRQLHVGSREIVCFYTSTTHV